MGTTTKRETKLVAGTLVGQEQEKITQFGQPYDYQRGAIRQMRADIVKLKIQLAEKEFALGEALDGPLYNKAKAS